MNVSQNSLKSCIIPRPRYGLIISTSAVTNKLSENCTNGAQVLLDNHWSQMGSKILRYKWTHTWNYTYPASWTFAQSEIDSIAQPKVLAEDSADIVNTIHSLLDALPEYGPLGYLLDIIWITDKIASDIANPSSIARNDEDHELPAALYGALKRSYDWHGARIHVLNVSNQALCVNDNSENDRENDNFLQFEIGAKIMPFQEYLETSDCFSSCKSCSSDRLIWRGSLGFYDESDASLCLRRMKGFEMFARDDKSLDMLSLMCENTNKGNNNNVLMSRTLKVITKCDVNSVPVYLLTSNHYYMTVTDSHDEVHDHFLSPEGEFFDNCGIIAKMDFIPLQGDASCKTRESKLTFEFWKQYITNSQSYGESLDQLDVFENEQEHLIFAKYNANQHGPDNQEQNTQSLFFLIMNDEDGGLKSAHPYDNGHYTKLCILLDPSAAEGGGQLKSYNKIQDTLQLNFQNEGKQLKEENQKLEKKLQDLSLTSEYDVPKLFTFIRQVQTAVLNMIVDSEGHDSEYMQADRIPSTLDAIQMHILTKINAFRLAPEKVDSDKIEETKLKTINPLYYEENESTWEEKRFLTFIERLKKEQTANKEPKSDVTMKPNVGDFVILEAKEMLKLFTKDGLAKNPENCEEIKVPANRNRVGFNWDKETEKYPELVLADYPDTCFNRNERSEELDRERAKLQLMYVGSKETASTCHVQNSSKGPPPVVVTKKKVADKDEKPAVRKGQSIHSKPHVYSKQHKQSPRKYQRANTTLNPAQLRRSPRKKVSTASMVSNGYNRILNRANNDASLADGRSSIYSGDGGSVASSIKGLPLPSSKYSKISKEKSEIIETDEKGDTGTKKIEKIKDNCSEDSKNNRARSSNVNCATGAAQENFKKKLRSAVFDALAEKKIDQNNKLFRPCFKKLFNICEMYGKDLVKKTNRGGTGQLLNKIARQNVDTVISLEEHILENIS